MNITEKSTISKLIEETEITIHKAEETLRNCYESIVRSSDIVGKAIDSINNGSNYAYTVHGLVKWARIDLRSIESSPRHLNALDRIMADNDITVDVMKDRLTRPVLDYVMLHTTRNSHTIVESNNGVEQTLLYCNAPITDKEMAKDLLRTTINRCEDKKLMVLLNETGDVEVVT